jgi:hypothetical protein
MASSARMSDRFDTSRYDASSMPSTSRYHGAEEAKDLAMMLADALGSIHSILKDLQANLSEPEREFHAGNMNRSWEIALWLDPGIEATQAHPLTGHSGGEHASAAASAHVVQDASTQPREPAETPCEITSLACVGAAGGPAANGRSDLVTTVTRCCVACSATNTGRGRRCWRRWSVRRSWRVCRRRA